MRSRHSSVIVRKVPRPAVHTERVARAPETAKRAVSATLRISSKTVKLLAKNAINVALRTISAHVTDLLGATDKTQTNAEVEHQHAAGVQRDITNPIEADAPGPDRGCDQAVNQRHEALTALTDMT